MNLDYNIFYINLDERIDRNEHMQKQFSKQNINAIRYSAFKPNLNLPKYNLKASALGCFLSHYNIIKQAIKNNDQKLLIIFEDDIIILDKFNDRLQSVLLNLPEDWDFCYLSFAHYINHTFDSRLEKVVYKTQNDAYQFINDVIVKFKFPLCTHSYMINPKSLTKIINYLDNNIMDLDISYILMQNNNINVYCAVNNLTYQDWDIPSSIFTDQ